MIAKVNLNITKQRSITMELVISSKENLKEIISEQLKEVIHNSKPQPIKSEDGTVLLTVKEAADFLHVTPTTIHIWKAQGRISFKKIGRRTLFDKNELLKSLTNIQMPKRK